jgi:chitodextrinase
MLAFPRYVTYSTLQFYKSRVILQLSESISTNSIKLGKTMKKFNVRNVPRPIAVVAVFFAFALVGSYLLSATHASGSATLTLSPATSNVSLGSTIIVTITENSGTTAVNAVQANLTYDQTKLQFVSIDTSTSAFALTAQSSGGNGTVSIANASSTAVTGAQTVAKVTFTAVGLGASSVNFAAGSGIAEATNNTDVLGVSTGATYTVVDSTAPSVPTSLAAPTRAATSITVTWTASTDNVGVTGYKIYRGGTQVGTSATPTYTDTGLTPNTSYSYTVAANDAVGNTSAQSSPFATSTTPDNTAPSVPSALTVNTRALTSIKFTWTASTDNVGVTSYKVFRNGTQIGTSSTATYTDIGLASGTNYSYTVAAADAAGNTSAQSSPLATSTLADTTAPSVPTSLNSSGQTTTGVSLTWTASTDDVAVAGYKVFRGGTQIATSPVASFSDTGLTPGTSYSYTVAAYDAAGNTSAQTGAKVVSTTSVSGDANHDGHVDFLDLSVIAASWQSTTDLRADFNNDHVVNFLDLSLLAANWGK